LPFGKVERLSAQVSLLKLLNKYLFDVDIGKLRDNIVLFCNLVLLFCLSECYGAGSENKNSHGSI